MLSKLFATLFVLFLISVYRRLRDERLETEAIKAQQRSAVLAKKPKLKLASRKATANLLKKRNKKRKGKYAAVSVRFTPNACDAVKSLAGERFLAKDAPLMPLQQCPRRNICNCFYEYHEDRRTSDERSDFNLQFGILPNYEEGENQHRRWYDHEQTFKQAS